MEIKKEEYINSPIPGEMSEELRVVIFNNRPRLSRAEVIRRLIRLFLNDKSLQAKVYEQ